MPESCCVVGCSARRDAMAKFSCKRFYRIPIDRHKRAQWVFAISRKNWIPKKWDRVCARHFVTGKPSNNPQDVDYKPTLYMKGNLLNSKQEERSASTSRTQRFLNRTTAAHMNDVAEVYRLVAFLFYVFYLLEKLSGFLDQFLAQLQCVHKKTTN